MFKSEVNKITKEVKRKGYTVIPDFFSANECEELIKNIDTYSHKLEDQIWSSQDGSDKRIFGFNNINKLAQKFFENKFIRAVFSKLVKIESWNGFVMSGCIKYVENNKGSGQGWHRDSAPKDQLKAIVYLTDVDFKNGPFQYVPKSHSLLNKKWLKFKYGINLNKDRFESSEDKELVSKLGYDTLTGKAGTLIITNTSGIHRGMPLVEGSRYALTFYLWHNSPIPKHIEKLIVKNEMKNEI